MCKCESTQLGFSNWGYIQKVATVGENGFGDIPDTPRIYCLRARRIGESDKKKIADKYLRKSPLYNAFLQVADSSEDFFKQLGFGPGWGWKGYRTGPETELEKIHRFKFDAPGRLDCPILYIGRGRSLRDRVIQLMEWKHVFSHGLWALLYSEWQIELAWRLEADYKNAEALLKKAYKNEHDKLPPFVVR